MHEVEVGGRRLLMIHTGNHGVIRAFRYALATGMSPEGWLAIEGPILFIEALQEAERGDGAKGGSSERGSRRLKIHSVVVTERESQKLDEALRRLPPETEVSLISESLLRRVAQTQTPQGIAALVELPESKLDVILTRHDVVVVVACGLQDPGNLGSIMRSAQALGGAALLTLPNTVSPFNPKVVRSSAGAVLRLPIFANLEWASLLPRLRSAGLQVVAADPHSALAASQADLRGPVALLIGREASGLEASLSRQADASVAIPLRGQTDSLNAAVAASILLYEIARQRGLSFDEPV